MSMKILVYYLIFSVWYAIIVGTLIFYCGFLFRKFKGGVIMNKATNISKTQYNTFMGYSKDYPIKCCLYGTKLCPYKESCDGYRRFCDRWQNHSGKWGPLEWEVLLDLPTKLIKRKARVLFFSDNTKNKNSCFLVCGRTMLALRRLEENCAFG